MACWRSNTFLREQPYLDFEHREDHSVYIFFHLHSASALGQENDPKKRHETAGVSRFVCIVSY